MNDQNSAKRNAILIGALGTIAYFALALARNVLGVVTAQMQAEGFTEQFFGTASSVYFLCYGSGQLINGILGEKIKARYMVSVGLFFGAVSNLVFTHLIYNQTIAFITYGFTGYFLSMIYAPLTKAIAENNAPRYAARCCLGMQVGSLSGAPVAGFIAAFGAWQSIFNASSIFLVSIAITFFISFLHLEKQGVIVYNQVQTERSSQSKKEKLQLLLKRGIVKISLIRIVCNVVGTTVPFWLTLYLSDYLNFSIELAPTIYSGIMIMVSLAPFLSVFVYERLKCNMELTMFLSFLLSFVCFISGFFFRQAYLNAALISIAILSSQMGAALIGTVYCTSLRDMGMVSSVTGYLDFVAYMASAVSTVLFANAVVNLGWKNLILIWAACVGVGALTILIKAPFQTKKTQ